MRWIKDPKVESQLRRLGIKFSVMENIPLRDIDREEGMRRQVRLINKVDEDVVLRYAMAMQEEGAAFPYPVLQKEKKRLWPWSGNHRLASADLAGVEVIDAYIIELFDPVMQDLLPRLVNTWEAVKGQSKEEAIINATYMVDKHGWTPQEAATTFGLKVEAIHKGRRVEEVKGRIQSIGVDPNGFPDSLLNDLYRISNQNVLKKAAKLIHDYKVKGVEARQIINDAYKQSTEAQQISTLERWEGTLTARQRPKRKAGVKAVSKLANRDRFIKLITALSRFLQENNTVERAQITDPVDQDLILREYQTINRLMSKMAQGR